MRSVRKTNASWRSGARPRSAGRKVVHGLPRSARRACSGGSSSPRSARASSSARSATAIHNVRARRHPPVFADFAGSSGEAPASCAFFRGASFWQRYCSLGHGARDRCHRIRGQSSAAPPAAEGRPVRALARQPRAPARRGRRARRPPHRRGSRARRSRAARPRTTSCTRWRPAANGDFAGRDRRMAEAFGEAAARAGVERIVYLGGIVPPAGPLSPHLQLAARGGGDAAGGRARARPRCGPRS